MVLAVENPCDQLLARARFPDDENRSLLFAQPAGLLSEFSYGGAVSDQLISSRGAEPCFGSALSLEKVLFEDPSDRLQDSVQGQGLLEKIRRAELDRLDGRVHGSMTGHDHDFDVCIEFFDRLQRLDTVHAGKPDVQEDDVRVFRADQLHGLGPVAGRPDLEALILQAPSQRVEDVLFVIDDEYLCFEHHVASSFALVLSSQGPMRTVSEDRSHYIRPHGKRQTKGGRPWPFNPSENKGFSARREERKTLLLRAGSLVDPAVAAPV